jgi:hypothetical protein
MTGVLKMKREILGLTLLISAGIANANYYCPPIIKCETINDNSCTGSFPINPIFKIVRNNVNLITFKGTYYFLYAIDDASGSGCTYVNEGGLASLYLKLLRGYPDTKGNNNKWGKGNGIVNWCRPSLKAPGNSYDCPFKYTN